MLKNILLSHVPRHGAHTEEFERDTEHATKCTLTGDK
jgi:hypothetical protein